MNGWLMQNTYSLNSPTKKTRHHVCISRVHISTSDKKYYLHPCATPLQTTCPSSCSNRAGHTTNATSGPLIVYSLYIFLSNLTSCCAWTSCRLIGGDWTTIIQPRIIHFFINGFNDGTCSPFFQLAFMYAWKGVHAFHFSTKPPTLQ